MTTASITLMDGHLYSGSTCTINGRTVPVPPITAYRWADEQVNAAIQALGYPPIEADDLYTHLVVHGDYCTIAVNPT